MKVLFTCVGKSDPLTIFENEKIYDAAFLQIARNYKPDVIYLYMSKEICEFDDLDNRYERSIFLLNEHLGINIEIEKIKRPGLVEVQKFDDFYDDFENIMDEIIQERGSEVEILCNVSSGTPAMKATLQILAALSKYRITPIQVSDPTKGRYKRDVDLNNYDLEFFWELNEDNEIKENRTYLSANDKFNFKIQKELLVNLINSYDYEAAYNMAMSYRYRIDKNLISLLKFALNRYNLDSEAILKDHNRNLLPYQDNEKAKLFEYGLWLKIKKEKGELLDFVRGVTPFLYGVCAYTFKNILNIDILNYCERKGKVMYLTRKGLEKDATGLEFLEILDNRYKDKRYSDTFLSENQMLTILNEKLDNFDLNLCLKQLNNLRVAKRNIASHQITCVREKDIISDLDNSMDDYVNIIKKVLACLGFSTSSYWNSYDDMNSYIIEEINKMR